MDRSQVSTLAEAELHGGPGSRETRDGDEPAAVKTLPHPGYRGPHPGFRGPRPGFTGKIPSRGDFVQAGLPRDFTEPWHDWQATVIAGSRELMGAAWLPAFLEAPVWRFALPAGTCGTLSAIGLMLPSVDKAGRYFPLTFAAVSATAGTPDRAGWTNWLDTVESLGRRALEEDISPEQLMPPPCPPIPFPSALFGSGMARSGTGDSLWWTDGGPLVTAMCLTLAGLPDSARFALMLGHPTAAEHSPGAAS